MGGLGGVTITKPPGTVATDVLICVIAIGGANLSDTITTPADWTLIAPHVDQSDGTNRVELYAFWALGSTSNLSFSFAGLTLNSSGWLCAAFTGADNAAPIDVANSGVSNTGATSLSCGALTIVDDGCWEMAACADHLLQTLSAPGCTLASNGSPASFQSAALLYNTTPLSPGAAAAIVISAGGSGTGQILAALAFALKPAVLPPPPKHPVRATLVNRPYPTGKGVVIRTPIPMAVPVAVGNSDLEWEVRLYTSGGKRIRLPREWIDSIEFELAENGGMQNGTMQILAEWEALQPRRSEIDNAFISSHAYIELAPM